MKGFDEALFIIKENLNKRPIEIFEMVLIGKLIKANHKLDNKQLDKQYRLGLIQLNRENVKLKRELDILKRKVLGYESGFIVNSFSERDCFCNDESLWKPICFECNIEKQQESK